MTDRLIRITTALAVVAVAVVAAIISYQHAYELVRSHGESGATARLLPFMVVVLPVPLGPGRAKMVPSGTCRLMPSEHHLVAGGFAQPSGRDRWWGLGFLVPRLWCGAQANSSPSNSGSMAMGAGR